MSSDFEAGRVRFRAADLQVNYERTVALDVPELTASGRIIAVIGHNGSGKSTLIKSILQLLVPKKGSLVSEWVGPDGSATPLVPEEHMAFAQENGGVFADISVESYVRLWCRIKRRDSNYYKGGGRAYIDALNIAPLFGKLGRELSKGQRRRVQAAVGFLTSPRLFLFDEPFDGLDIAQSTQLANTMHEASRSMGMVLSSHRMDVVERLADLVIVLQAGKVLTVGGVEQVCRMLCGASVVISNSAEYRLELISLLPALKREFYSCLVNQIGDQVMITGNEVSLQSVQTFFSRCNLGALQLNMVTPSLVDAMHYHLNRTGIQTPMQ